MVYSNKVLLLYLASSWLFAVIEGQKEAAACSQEGQVRATTESLQTNGTCTVVNLINIQVCENGGWHEICDEDFTDNDAKVICRELNYSDIGAVATRLTGQLLRGFATINSPMCNGMESMLSECGTVMSDATTESGSCVYTKVVARCFPKASDNCVSTERPQTTDGASSEAVFSTTLSDSTHSTTESSHTTTTGPSTSPSNNQPDSILIVIFVLGAIVLISLMFLLMLVIVSCLCYKSKCRSRHSPVYEEAIIVTKSYLHSDLVDKRGNQHLNVSEAMCATMKDKSLTAAKTATTGMNDRVEDNSQMRDVAVDLKENIAYATRITMETESESNVSHQYEVVDPPNWRKITPFEATDRDCG